MVDCFWPETPEEPWHAVFKAPYGTNDSAYRAASNYGKLLISNGLADNYILHGLNNGGVIEYHCIPTTQGGGKSILDYWISITT